MTHYGHAYQTYNPQAGNWRLELVDPEAFPSAAAGPQHADKLENAIATALKDGMTATDIEHVVERVAASEH